MASFASLVVSARAVGMAALTRARAGTAALGRATRDLSNDMRRHTVVVSSVAGAYRDANGIWRNADGTLVMQRNHLRRVTTAMGHFRNATRSAGHAMRDLGGIILPGIAPMAKWGAILGAIPSLIVPATAAIVSLLGAIQLIAPATIAAVSVLATMKMAFSGIGDALKAGMSGDVEAFNKALDKLPDSARSAVLTMLDLRKEWVSTQKAVQGRFFAGFRDDIISVSRAIQPVADRWLPKMADALAVARTQISRVFSASAGTGQLDRIMQGVHGAIKGITGAAGPMLEAFLDIAEVAAPAFQRIGEYIQNVADRFAAWTGSTEGRDTLKRWLDSAMKSLGTLKEIAYEVGRVLGGIFTSGEDSGQTMLQNIRDIVAAMADFVNSENGKNWVKIFGDIGAAITDVSTVFGFLLENARVVSTMTIAYFGIMGEMVARVLIGLLGPFAHLIPGMREKLDQMGRFFEGFRDRANAALDGIADETVNVTIRSQVIGDRRLSGSELSGTYGGGGGRATGGVASGIIRVGEHGEEIVDMNRRMVFSNNDSRTTGTRSMSSGGGSGGGTTVGFSGFIGDGAGVGLAQVLNKLLRDGLITWKVDNRGLVRAAGR